MSMWEQERYQQVDTDAENTAAGGKVIGEVDMHPHSLVDEAKHDRAAGRPTSGTRGYADTEAFNRDQ